MSSISVTVLGCSGSYAAPGTACTGYLLQAGGKNVLLDCGPGTLANLQRHLPLEQLDAVVITHCHPDHWVELPVMRAVWTWFLHRNELPVYGTRETQLMNRVVCGGADPEAFSWKVIDGASTITIGEQRWRFSPTDHPVETLAVRVDVDGCSFAFSSDTGPRWSIDQLGLDMNLVICEASYTSVREPEGVQHLSARQAGAMAKAAGVRRLVVTHQMPGANIEAHATEASEAFGRTAHVAQEHAVYTV